MYQNHVHRSIMERFPTQLPICGTLYLSQSETVIHQMLLRKVLKKWFRWNIFYSETFLILMVFYHCSLIKHRKMLLHLTPHTSRTPKACSVSAVPNVSPSVWYSFPPHALSSIGFRYGACIDGTVWAESAHNMSSRKRAYIIFTPLNPTFI